MGCGLCSQRASSFGSWPGSFQYEVCLYFQFWASEGLSVRKVVKLGLIINALTQGVRDTVFRHLLSTLKLGFLFHVKMEFKIYLPKKHMMSVLSLLLLFCCGYRILSNNNKQTLKSMFIRKFPREYMPGKYTGDFWKTYKKHVSVIHFAGGGGWWCLFSALSLCRFYFSLGVN